MPTLIHKDKSLRKAYSPTLGLALKSSRLPSAQMAPWGGQEMLSHGCGSVWRGCPLTGTFYVAVTADRVCTAREEWL